MTRSTRRILLGLAFAATTDSVAVPLLAQRGGAMTEEQRDVRWEREKELQSLAVVERKVMMPMRDGVRLETDIYRPKTPPARSRSSSSRPLTTSTTGTSAMACRRT